MDWNLVALTIASLICIGIGYLFGRRDLKDHLFIKIQQQYILEFGRKLRAHGVVQRREGRLEGEAAMLQELAKKANKEALRTANLPETTVASEMFMDGKHVGMFVGDPDRLVGAQVLRVDKTDSYRVGEVHGR